MTIKNLATELCRKYPESPSLSLARRLYGENPELIASLEAARSAIRTARGANGKANRKIATAVREKGIPHNPLALPEPVALDFKPFVLRNAKALIISDVHIPYHDLVALTAAMQAGKKAGCDTLIILGDLMDFYQLSRFLKDPRARSVAEEINDTKQFSPGRRRDVPPRDLEIWQP
jgi:hypothetical protein